MDELTEFQKQYLEMLKEEEREELANNDYHSRRNSDCNYNNKNKAHIKTLSQKLFKMNGIVSVDTWIEFSSHFFAGNPLVFEYFERKYSGQYK